MEKPVWRVKLDNLVVEGSATHSRRKGSNKLPKVKLSKPVPELGKVVRAAKGK